jgi:6-phosphogluconolactonase
VKTFELAIFPDASSLAQFVAERWLNEVQDASARGDAFFVALSGGRIAKGLFLSAARTALERSISFEHVHFFWADERCVPPGDPESNFALAWQNLLLPLGIQTDRIHRIPGEGPPDSAAAKAEDEIKRVISRKAEGFPVLDLVLLGMGEDGHVASLFPNDSADAASNPAIYLHVIGPKAPPHRITISYEMIAAGRQVWVLASGIGKEEALQNSLGETRITPLARVLRMRGKTLIYTDLKFERTFSTDP